MFVVKPGTYLGFSDKKKRLKGCFKIRGRCLITFSGGGLRLSPQSEEETPAAKTRT